MSQYQTASHGKEGSTIRSSVWYLSPYSRLHFLHEVLCVKRVDRLFLGVSRDVRIRNHTHHHIPPLPGTELVVSAPRTGRQSAVGLLPSPSLLERDNPVFQREKGPSHVLLPSLIPDHRAPRHTYTSERPESSTAREQSSLTEARKGALGEKEGVGRHKAHGSQDKT